MSKETAQMCWDCPHSITGNAQTDEMEYGLLEAMAESGERHDCHNAPSLLCIGQRIGCFVVIESTVRPIRS